MAGYAVFGLGNPGAKYAGNRHNVGFMVLQRLAERLSAGSFAKQQSGSMAHASFAEHGLLLFMPDTYMNLSGVAVRHVLEQSSIPAQNLIVVHDDLDLPFGTLRVKVGGGHGGHNGIRSTMAELGTGDFARLKVGISRPPEGVSVTDHVLGDFSPDEATALNSLLDKACDAVLAIIEGGAQEAMARYN